MACTTTTLTQPININIDEIQTYNVGNSGDIITFVESNLGTAPAFTFDKSLVGWTINAYARRSNNISGSPYTVGTAAGLAINTQTTLTVDFSTAIATDGTGDYIFEIWAVNDLDETKKVILHPSSPNQIITLKIVNRIQNG